jgi:hypothetical protein
MKFVMLNEVGRGITTEIKGKILLGLDNSAAHPHSYPLKNIHLESFSQHHILSTANGHRNHNKSEDLLPRKVGKLQP